MLFSVCCRSIYYLYVLNNFHLNFVIDHKIYNCEVERTEFVIFFLIIVPEVCHGSVFSVTSSETPKKKNHMNVLRSSEVCLSFGEQTAS